MWPYRQYIIDSQNHRIAWIERDFKDHSVPTPCCRLISTYQLKTPSKLVLSTSRDGAASVLCFTFSVQPLPVPHQKNISS